MTTCLRYRALRLLEGGAASATALEIVLEDAELQGEDPARRLRDDLSELRRLHPPDVADFAPLRQRLPVLDPADEHEAEPGNSAGELLCAAEGNEREAPIVLRRVRLRADVGMKARHAQPGLFEDFPPDGV